MTHFPRAKLERAMGAYMVGPTQVHRSPLETYAVPCLVSPEEHKKLTSTEWTRLANWLIEDWIAIGFMVPDPRGIPGLYILTRRGRWMKGDAYLLTRSKLVRLWRRLTWRFKYQLAWRQVPA